MENSDRQKVTLLKQTAELFNRELSPMLLALYLKCLQPYTAAEVHQALQAHLLNPESGQFMPKPADIVKHLTGGTETQGLKAWTIVEKAVKHIGPYASVCFEDGIINQVITEMGGWITLGSKTLDEWPFVKNEFIKRYTGFLLSPATQIFPNKLIGLQDHTEALKSMSNSEVRFIACDTQFAKQSRRDDLETKLIQENTHGCTLPTGQIEFH